MLRVSQFTGFGNLSLPTVPTVVASATNSNASSTASHIINLPTGIIAGDLLVAVLGNNGDRTHTWPSGWVELGDTLNGTISSATIGYRIANGTEGSTITVTASTSSVSVAICAAIRNRIGAPTTSTVATGTSTAPNSGSVAIRNGLFLSTFGGRQTANILGYSVPSGYTVIAATQQNSAGGAVAGMAHITKSIASEDPPAWSVSASCNWVAWTIAI